MQFVIALMMASIQIGGSAVSNEESAHFQSAISELKQINATMDEIYNNAGTLSIHQELLQEEIAVANKLYPDLNAPANITVVELSQRLSVYKDRRVTVLKPMIDTHIAHMKQDSCNQIIDLEKKYNNVRATDGYEKLSLKDRLTLRTSMETMIAGARAELGSYQCNRP